MNFDLTIRPPKKELSNRKPTRVIDPRLPFNQSCFCAFVGLPRSGKTTSLLSVLGSSQFTRGLYNKIIFIGASLKTDKTMKKLIEYYGEHNAYDYFDDNLIKAIINNHLTIEEEQRENLCIVIDDALSLGKKFERSAYMGRLGGSHRHWLRGFKTNGCCIISSQKLFGYGGLPTPVRTCLNVIVIFRVAGEQKLKIIETYEGMFGGKQQMEDILDYCLSEPFQSCNIYIDGNGIYQEPVIYKSWAELVYPTPMFPKKSIFGEETEDKNIEL